LGADLQRGGFIGRGGTAFRYCHAAKCAVAESITCQIPPL
jgi:hypothetical protein